MSGSFDGSDIPVGTYELGPGNGRLTVATGKTGAAAKAGHNLLLEVAVWSAQLVLGPTPSESSLTLTADGGSLRVVAATGGIQDLSAEDRSAIVQTIREEILTDRPIVLTSRSVERSTHGDLAVAGTLNLLGISRPVRFELVQRHDGHIAAAVVVRQSDFGLVPYSTLFGTLRVKDEVTVSVELRPFLQ